MRPILLYSIFVILVLVTGAILISTGMTPKIYQIAYDSVSTPFHTNIEVIRVISVNSTTDLLPVMQDLLDFSGTIAFTIRKNDLDTAGSELAEYSKRYQDLKNIILKLDMNESEVADFSRNANLQNYLIRLFVNTSESLQSLKTLEIQYHEDNDPTSLTTVQIQGKALEEKIRSLNTRYSEVTRALSDQGASKGLDTTLVDKGREEINNYTQSVVSDQESRDMYYQTNLQADAIIGQRISFLVQPDYGKYRDTINIFGYLTGGNITCQKVVILLDTSSFIDLTTDDTGLFGMSYEIENISVGNHSLVAVSGPAQSGTQALMITGSNTTLTLTLTAVKNRAEVNLTGILSAQKFVKNAPVQILVNNETWKMAVTGDTGRYMTNLSLPQGSFLVSAKFDDISFPLNESQSMTYEVVSTGTSITSITRPQATRLQPLWMIPVLLICFLGVSVLYLKRKGTLFQALKVHKDTGVPWNQPLDLSNVVDMPPGLPPFDLSGGSFIGSSGETHPSMNSEITFMIYTRLVNRLSEDLDFRHIRTLTPREISARIGFHPHADIIQNFIRLYEQIRYGRYEREEDIAAFESSISDVNAVLGSDLREE